MTENSAIVEAVTPVLAARGLDLYDLEFTGSGRAHVLRVLVTASAGSSAPDLDAISAAAEAISPALDAPHLASALPSPYALEVSSPGLERPLRRPEHYRGAIGETVSVKRRDAERTRGAIVGADDAGFDLAGADGVARRIPYDDVVQARTVFEWGAGASREKARR